MERSKENCLRGRKLFITNSTQLNSIQLKFIQIAKKYNNTRVYLCMKCLQWCVRLSSC